QPDRPRIQAALFLFLQGVSLGAFVAADLILFFVFFDLSIVGMYFVIAGWGHGNAARWALQFFLYTFLGALALLLGCSGPDGASAPQTSGPPGFVAATPLGDSPLPGGLVLGALVVAGAVKPLPGPFRTWLPPARTDAPAAGSGVLCAGLLK